MAKLSTRVDTIACGSSDDGFGTVYGGRLHHFLLVGPKFVICLNAQEEAF